MTNKSGCTAIKSSTGTGKSTMMRNWAGDTVLDLRAKGNAGSVVVFVPTIKLALEQMHKFREEHPFLTAECFIGLATDNPVKK